MTIFGVDVSDANSTTGVDMQAVRQEGFQFVIAQVSDGQYSDTIHPWNPKGGDMSFENNQRNALAAGIPFVAYQYYEPGEDNKLQAQPIVDQVAPGAPIMLDIEDIGPDRKADSRFNMKDYMSYVNYLGSKEGGNHPVKITYVPRWWWDELTPEQKGGYNLSTLPGVWDQSDYGQDAPINYSDKRHAYIDGYNQSGGDNGSGWVKSDGGAPAIWQFTDNYRTPWSKALNNQVDVDAFQGSVDDFRQRLGIPGPVSPSVTQPAPSGAPGTTNPGGNGPGQSTQLPPGEQYYDPPPPGGWPNQGPTVVSQQLGSLYSAVGRLLPPTGLGAPAPTTSQLLDTLRRESAGWLGGLRKTLDRQIEVRISTPSEYQAVTGAKSDGSRLLAFGRGR